MWAGAGASGCPEHTRPGGLGSTHASHPAPSGLLALPLNCPHTSSTQMRCPPQPEAFPLLPVHLTYRTRCPHGLPTAPRTACSPGQLGDALLMPSRGLEQLPAPVQLHALHHVLIAAADKHGLQRIHRRAGETWVQLGWRRQGTALLLARTASCALRKRAQGPPSLLPASSVPSPGQHCGPSALAGAEGAPACPQTPQLRAKGKARAQPVSPGPAPNQQDLTHGAAATLQGWGQSRGQLQVGARSVWLTEAALRVGWFGTCRPQALPREGAARGQLVPGPPPPTPGKLLPVAECHGLGVLGQAPSPARLEAP